MLRYCKNCGLLLPHDACACPQCGLAAPRPAEPARPAADAPRYDDGKREPVVPALSQADTTIAMVLFAIPLVGFVLAMVWSFAGGQNPARQRLARGYLIRTLAVAVCVAVFVLVAALVFSAVLHSQLAYSYYYYQ